MVLKSIDTTIWFLSLVVLVARIVETNALSGAAFSTTSPSSLLSSLVKSQQQIQLQEQQQQQLDRRKSPALWRLLYQDDSADEDINEYDHHHHDDNKSLSNRSTVTTTTTMTTMRSSEQRRRRQRRRIKYKPEIMSPAGGWPQLRAAVANGADSVYLGLSAFSARARASNFDPWTDELYQAVKYCHGHSVHVYVALNTLILDSEWIEIAHMLRLCQEANVDAVIVQDWGIPRLASQVAPHLPLHASTQQSITSTEGVLFCQEQQRQQHGQNGNDFGSNAFSRVVLGRELSVPEISHVIRQQEIEQHSIHDYDDVTTTITNGNAPAEIEVFVHGALCVSYSGQCFSSEAWGGRSANRGQCAQACRLPYGLIVNGQVPEPQSQQHCYNTFDDANLKYVLSPQDLCGLDQVPALIQAGVACFKIEGRLKDAAYVAATTRAYRLAVDQAWDDWVTKQQEEEQPLLLSPSRRRALPYPNDGVTRSELTQLFSRGQDNQYSGLTAGFLAGTHHQTVVRGRSPRHRGIHMGRLVQGTSSQSGYLVMEYDENQDEAVHGDDNSQATKELLKLGDGIVVDRGLPELEELGGHIFGLQPLDDEEYGDNNDNVSRRPGEGRNRRRVMIQLGRAVVKKWQQYDARQQQTQQHSNGVMVKGEGREWAPMGAHVWKTHDALVEKKFRRLSEAILPLAATLSLRSSSSSSSNKGNAIMETPQQQQQQQQSPLFGPPWFVTIKVTGSIGKPLQIHLELVDSTTIRTNQDGASLAVMAVAVGETDSALELAESKGLSTAQIQKAIGTLGNTGFTLFDGGSGNNENGGVMDFSGLLSQQQEQQDDGNDEKEANSSQTNLWCRVSQIKLARRRAVEQLQMQIRAKKVPNQAEKQQAKEDSSSPFVPIEKGLVSSDPLASTGVSGNQQTLGNIKDAPQRLLDEWVEKARAAEENNNSENQDGWASETGHFSVLCRTFEQVDAICSMLEAEQQDGDNNNQEGKVNAGLGGIVSEIVIDFLELEGMKEAVQRIRGMFPTALTRGVNVVVASPRILKPYEGGIWKSLLALEPDALLVRSTGLLYRMQALGGPGAKVKIVISHGQDDDDDQLDSDDVRRNDGAEKEERWVTIPKLIGDFSLNAANALSAFELLSYNPNNPTPDERTEEVGKSVSSSHGGNGGLERITASYDLNANAVAHMAKLLGPWSHRLEVVVHCKMPIFHTEHCVFARFLTKGNSYLDCGHACTRHSVHLRDELTGLDNLVLADMGW